MNEPTIPPPPSYEEIEPSIFIQNSNPNWRTWYEKFLGLHFNQNEIIKYTNLFVENDIKIWMISDLNDTILKSIGIEKAGHRIRILHLQNRNSPNETSRNQSFLNVLKCVNHPNLIANEKCCRCHRLLCLICRREKAKEGYPIRYYCETCFNNQGCIIL